MFNSQFPMFIRWDTDFVFCARLLSPRMRIEHWELSIGQIPKNVLNSYDLRVGTDASVPQVCR